ncbi:hypothetical protein V6N12_048935 [Hibiscus sabdariffa]|uniref:Endonuclease/exonuclease/phosphatase domain-containing protein n=1 Tax=Hibiscus sabdariffa TaxID=183260 RepID=A0ABR2EIQ7_9ROSI
MMIQWEELGGLALWWIAEVKLSTMSVSKNYIDSAVLMKGEPPRFCTFLELWCILGDSNIVCSQDEKIGGNAYDVNQAAPFQNMMDKCGLLEMPITSGAYTWSNMRTNDDAILEKIDRILFNVEWSLLLTKASSFDEPAIGSDHNPIVLQLERSPRRNRRTENGSKWLLDEECNRVVLEAWDKMGHRSSEVKLHGKLKNSKLKLLSWSKKKFGENIKTTEEILKKIALLQSAPLTMDTDLVKAELDQNHFKNVYKKEPTYFMEEILDSIPACISKEINDTLCTEVTEKEIQESVFNLGTPPGSDGFSEWKYASRC